MRCSLNHETVPCFLNGIITQGIRDDFLTQPECGCHREMAVQESGRIAADIVKYDMIESTIKL